MAGTAELRRRPNKKKKADTLGVVSARSGITTTNQSEATPAATEGNSNPAQPEPTLWSTFSKHPLVVALPIIGIPYLFYRLYFFVLLQHPEVLNGLLSLRPAVGLQDPRQVLIVGTQSSGTVQAAADLFDKLGLEVGHEASDASWHFVRDGTVSWFHGLRFIPPPEDDKVKIKSLLQLCTNYTGKMGFHPRMYRSTSDCSERQKWSKCWAVECMTLLNREFGCGLHSTEIVEDEMSSTQGCETPFFRTLHQVRHPMRTIESLVSKFCQTENADLDEGSVHPAFLQFASAIFPSTKYDWNSLSCVEAAALYVLEYNNAMLAAREKGRGIDAMYRIEETSPCQVAQLAGLTNKETTVYEPNFDKVLDRCGGPDDSEEDDLFAHHPAKDVMTSTEHKINVGLVDLELEDLRGGIHGSKRPTGNREFETAIRELTKRLGYDVNKRKAQDEKGQFY